jgi:hypothetical protein
VTVSFAEGNFLENVGVSAYSIGEWSYIDALGEYPVETGSSGLVHKYCCDYGSYVWKFSVPKNGTFVIFCRTEDITNITGVGVNIEYVRTDSRSNNHESINTSNLFIIQVLEDNATVTIYGY